MVKGDRVMSQTNFSKIGRSKGDKAFDTINFIISILILIVILYPLYLIVISSISDPNLVNSGQITFWPKGITLKGYELTFGNSNRSEEHTSELQSRGHLVCRLLLEKKKTTKLFSARYDKTNRV